jgi:two-component system, OmpR family, sensor histidine kinase KdpD
VSARCEKGAQRHLLAMGSLSEFRVVALGTRPDTLRTVIMDNMAATATETAPAESRERAGTRGLSGPERVMVCMSSSADAPRLVRRGELMAAGLGACLYAVYVETAKERSDRITPKDRETLGRTMALAQRLGATVVRVTAARTIDGLIEFARREGITHVILGQTQRSRWDIFIRGSVLDRFLREVPDASVEVLGESQS